MSKIKEEVRQIHLDFAENRGLEATFCPSEVARKVDAEHWRDIMDLVREVADDLIAENRLVVMQKGVVISGKATEAKGPIRLRKKE